ncbi:hypothetical protein [Rhodobacter sp. CZR27]|uniref:hypothetical protein n=1 Tax=Rhodobacter sp. CZR27 TaxID=2033869 RepID=UPI000BBE2EE0|nr:hypothetical protein [Rhodobacter sp. CZR27]
MSDIARIFAPLLVWLALFSAIYGLHGLGCGLDWPAIDVGGWSLQRIVLVSGWASAMVLQALVLGALVRAPRSLSPLVRQVSLVLGATGMAAVIWTLFPVAVASTCS